MVRLPSGFCYGGQYHRQTCLASTYTRTSVLRCGEMSACLKSILFWYGGQSLVFPVSHSWLGPVCPKRKPLSRCKPSTGAVTMAKTTTGWINQHRPSLQLGAGLGSLSCKELIVATGGRSGPQFPTMISQSSMRFISRHGHAKGLPRASN